MRTPDDRIEELVAAAAGGDLGPAEQIELDRLMREHPWIGEEVTRLRAVSARVRESGVAWEEPVVTESLRARVLGEMPAHAAPAPIRRRGWMPALLGAACLALGLVVGSMLPGLLSAPPAGPPGTLGAYEHLVVAEETGVEVDADLVAHTWGTEAVLDVTGLSVGERYRVVFIGEDGSEFPAGEMLGSEVPVHCRLNAAVLREDTVRMELRTETESVIASAELPHA